MKLKIFLMIFFLSFSSASAENMMEEHHKLMDEVMVLIKDMIGTMKEMSKEEKIKNQADKYTKRAEKIIEKHNQMKQNMPHRDEIWQMHQGNH